MQYLEQLQLPVEALGRQVECGEHPGQPRPQLGPLPAVQTSPRLHRQILTFYFTGFFMFGT